MNADYADRHSFPNCHVAYYGNGKDFCAFKKIDDSHLHRVCVRYRKEYDEARARAEVQKRFGKPNDIWVR